MRFGAARLEGSPPLSHYPSHGLEPLYQKGNSCTGRVVHALRIGCVNHGRPGVELSGLHNYWLSRHLWGGTDRDRGSYIRDAIKALKRYGAAPAAAWPETALNVQRRPSMGAQRAAHKFTAFQGYYRVDPTRPEQLKSVLASGHALFGGWFVNEEFLDKSGPPVIDKLVPSLSLGHAMVIDGYAADGMFHMVNSWRGWRGTQYAASGAWLTEEFVAQGRDMWAIVVQ